MPFRQTTIRNNLILRSRVMEAIRQFFRKQGYLEVETPVRIPAPAPEAHIDAQASDDWYLQTSPELAMKRLLAAGFEKIFQICRCFRKGERGGRHLPELTLLEWYTADADYGAMMAQTEALIRHVVRSVGPNKTMAYGGNTVGLDAPWARLSVSEAFLRYGKTAVGEALAAGSFDEIMGLTIEPQLGFDRPTFLTDYPAVCGALARKKPGAPHIAERFELYICGLELCNAFSELTDPVEQRRRFEAENRLRQNRGHAPYPMPEPFLEALSRMPAAAGNALGIDRLVMLLADTDRIDHVVAFTPEEL
ncbi:MAG: EF-P lysine aminoacylase GenX [Desulfobacterales bacterium]|nr:EF-P lysine aminoacylase GenX [Desulfobacterales bacterium]